MEQEASDLVERPELIAALSDQRAGVVLIDGASGSGKTVLLKQASSAARLERWVSGPHEMMWSDPLIEVMLRCLADVVAQVIDTQRAAERFAEKLVGTLRRMTETRGREFAQAAGTEMLALVRARLGPEAGAALLDAVRALREETADSLGARLERARVEVAREVVTGFANDAIAIADGRPILLVLDRCERFDEANLRLLADLRETLSDGVQIWVAARTDSSAGVFLPKVEVAVVSVSPLDVPDVRELLERGGHHTTSATRVLERTNGVALDVQAYLGIMGDDAVAPDEDAEAILVADTALRLGRLSEAHRKFALRASALSDPLPREILALAVDGDAVECDRALKALDIAGLFTAHSTGAWIHERRRDAIQRLADDAERGQAIADAADMVWAHLVEGGDDLWMVELAGLASNTDRLAPDDDTLSGVLNANRAGLAVLAGLIELTEESSDQVVDAEALLKYVRDMFPTDADELEALQELERLGIVVVAANERAAAAVARLSALARAVAIGRIARELEEMPVPSIASVAFHEVLIPRIEPFVEGQLGVGHPTLRELSYMAMGEVEDIWHHPSVAARRGAAPAVIVRAKLSGRPLYGAFRFSSASDRDRARDAVAGLDVDFLSERLSVSVARAYPMGTVPADRFVRAMEAASSRRLTQHGRSERLSTPLTYAQLAELRVRAHKVLRDLAGEAMRGAMELEEPLSLHWFERGNGVLMVEVAGGREIAQEHVALTAAARKDGPYRRFHLARELGLRTDEWITTLSEHWHAVDDYALTRFDPVLAEIAERRKNAVAYNAAQAPLPVSLDDTLADLMERAFRREMADARALADALPPVESPALEVPSRIRYVAIAEEAPSNAWVPGARSTTVWAEMASSSGEDGFHMAFMDGREVREPPFGDTRVVDESALTTFSGFDDRAMIRGGHGRTTAVLAKLLGFREEDLDLRYRGER